MRSITVLFLLFCIFSRISFADEMRPALVQIQQIDTTHYDILWKLPARGNKRLKVNLILDGQLPPKQRLARFVAGSYVETWTLQRADGIQGLSVSVDNITSSFTDIIIRYQNTKGELLTGRLSVNSPEFIFDSDPSFDSVVSTYTKLGIEHILIGSDHLLFVACLVLIAGFSRKLLWAITGFTVAHSITLALSALDILVLPIAPIEAVIALSIVFLAVEIAKKQQNSLTYRYPVVVSSSFGLLHGFGFAAVLAEIGLPQSDLVTGLLFFNIGVEIGQLIFITSILLVLSLLNKIKFFAWNKLERLTSYIIGSIAVMWCIERVLAF